MHDWVLTVPVSLGLSLIIFLGKQEAGLSASDCDTKVVISLEKNFLATRHTGGAGRLCIES